ncbi:MAG TPA: hypothetical protein VID03_04400 [Acidimicrobiia bacterium]|jgi:hypothetical protein
MSSNSTGSEPSAWAVGGVVFAATIMLVNGMFMIIEGLAAVLNNSFYVVTDNYAFNIDVTAWGWVHMILGVLILLTGLALFRGSGWAGVVAIVLAVFGAIANFAFIPYYPGWAILMVAMNVFVIWAVSRSGVLQD